MEVLIANEVFPESFIRQNSADYRIFMIRVNKVIFCLYRNIHTSFPAKDNIFFQFGKIRSVGIRRPIKHHKISLIYLRKSTIAENRKLGCFHGNNCLTPSNERANSAAEYSSENVMNGRKKWAAHGQYCCQQLTAKTAGESIQTKVSSVFQRTSSGNFTCSCYYSVFLYWYFYLSTEQARGVGCRWHCIFLNVFVSLAVEYRTCYRHVNSAHYIVTLLGLVPFFFLGANGAWVLDEMT